MWGERYAGRDIEERLRERVEKGWRGGKHLWVMYLWNSWGKGLKIGAGHLS